MKATLVVADHVGHQRVDPGPAPEKEDDRQGGSQRQNAGHSKVGLSSRDRKPIEPGRQAARQALGEGRLILGLPQFLGQRASEFRTPPAISASQEVLLDLRVSFQQA